MAAHLNFFVNWPCPDFVDTSDMTERLVSHGTTKTTELHPGVQG
jgi:hypothetical protein